MGMRNNILMSILPLILLAADERPPEGEMIFPVRYLNYNDMLSPRKRLRASGKRGQRRYRARMSGLR